MLCNASMWYHPPKPISLHLVLPGSLCWVPKLCDDWENQEVEQFGELFIHYSFTQCAYNAVQQASTKLKTKMMDAAL